MFRYLISAAALRHFASLSVADLPRLRCDFYKSEGCAAASCYDLTTKSWSIIDWGKSTYSVCDPSGCQVFAFEAWPDGVYVSLTFPRRDLMAKVNETDLSIVETATMLNTSISSFGNCRKDEGGAR